MVLLCWILTLQQNAACERWILRYVYILRRSSINIFLYISDESTTWLFIRYVRWRSYDIVEPRRTRVAPA